MTNKAKKRLFLIYGICLSVLLAVSGALLAAGCYNIYKIGNRPFTPEAISSAFEKIQAILFITLGAVIVGGCMKVLFPLEDEKSKALGDTETTLRRTAGRFDVAGGENDAIAPFKRLSKLRQAIKWTTTALCTLLAIPSLIAALLPASYTMEYNQSVKTLCFIILPTFVLCAALCIAFVFVNEHLAKKQISLLKSLIAQGKLEKRINTECSSCARRKERYNIAYTRIIVLTLAVVFIALGIKNGGMADVLAKAINICTECIGLG